MQNYFFYAKFMLENYRILTLLAFFDKNRLVCLLIKERTGSNELEAFGPARAVHSYRGPSADRLGSFCAYGYFGIHAKQQELSQQQEALDKQLEEARKSIGKQQELKKRFRRKSAGSRTKSTY